MAKIDFPVATSDGQIFVADTNVIYTYVGTPPAGYWSGYAGIDPDSLGNIFVKVAGDNMTGNLTLGTDKITLNAGGDVTADRFIGDGSLLTNLPNSAPDDLQSVTDAGNTTSKSILIGGTLPSAPNIELNAGGNISLTGDIINTVTNGNQDIICDGSGLVEVTEYNLSPMEVVTKHDIGTAANEVPLNGFLGTLAYKNDFAIQDGLAVADLPASPTARVGNIARVTDGAASLTWGATVTGGGTAQYLVWYNGTNWTVFGA